MNLTPEQIRDLAGFLDELNDELLKHADASMEPGDERFHGNWEMNTLTALESLRAGLPKELQ